MLSGQNKLCSVVDHPNYFICIFNNPDFTHSEVLAPRDEEQQDCIVLMVEWLMMIALPFFVNESQDDHSSPLSVLDIQMNSLSPPTLHTSWFVYPSHS